MLDEDYQPKNGVIRSRDEFVDDNVRERIRRRLEQDAAKEQLRIAAERKARELEEQQREREKGARMLERARATRTEDMLRSR